MVKTNDVIKVEALRLREAGETIKQIVTKTGLSKSTLLKHFKKNGVIKSVVTPPPIKNDTPINNPTPKGEKSDIINNNDTKVSQPISDTFRGSKVTYDMKRGDISIEALDTLPITIPEEANGKRLMANETPLALRPEPLAPPEFNKDGINLNTGLSTVTSIIPFVLMAAGFLLKDKAQGSEQTNSNRGGEW